ncbi:ribonuclease H-like domain-containing protein [Tanacetum coccineum]|uniref:Ribonuclease H-like domain-containing protein n=1 Tax=Tanacetum coccineum TaxID=301880 RepID=A0ABQ5GQW2_9ASTR
MKTPYEILMGRSPNISFVRPFGCPLTILNTLDQLGKFDGKSEEGYLLGYSTSSKGFRVYNRVTRKVQDCLHIDFLENQENQSLCPNRSDWMFDLELLTPSMNYIPIWKENYADSGGKVSTYDDVEDLDDHQFIVHGPSIHAAQNKHSEERTADKEVPFVLWEQAYMMSLRKEVPIVTLTLSTAKHTFSKVLVINLQIDDDVPKMVVFLQFFVDEIYTDNEEDGAPDYNNIDHTIDVSSTPTLRIHKNHPQSQIIGKSTAGVLTRRKLKESAYVQHQALLGTLRKSLQALLMKVKVGLSVCKRNCFNSKLQKIESNQNLVAILYLSWALLVYQLDVKSAFLYGQQSPKRYDIIFGSTKTSMVKDFEDLMQKEFKMSSIDAFQDSDYAGTIMIDDQLRRMSYPWKKTGLWQ